MDTNRLIIIKTIVEILLRGGWDIYGFFWPKNLPEKSQKGKGFHQIWKTIGRKLQLL